MKFGHLIEHNMRNILEKLYTKCGVETIFRPFSEKSKLSISLSSLKFYTVCFYCMPSYGLSKYIETKLQTIYFYLIKKQKEVWN